MYSTLFQSAGLPGSGNEVLSAYLFSQCNSFLCLVSFVLLCSNSRTVVGRTEDSLAGSLILFLKDLFILMHVYTSMSACISMDHMHAGTHRCQRMLRPL